MTRRLSGIRPGRALSGAAHQARSRGVTLVELVVVMTIIGLVAGLGATLVGRVVSAQQDTRGRLTLGLSADAAMARVADDLYSALPNSVRVTSNAGGVWLEWVPVVDGGRWRAAVDTVAAGPGDPLDLSDASDNSFDVIGTPVGTPAGTLVAGSQLVIQNLGTPEADAYAGSNRRSGVALLSAGRRVSFTAAGALPNSTGTQRFFLVATPLTLACVPVGGGVWELARYSGYGWLSGQPVSSATLSGATRTLLLGGMSGCSAAYSTALANIGLVNLRYSMGTAGTAVKMDFMQQLSIENTP